MAHSEVRAAGVQREERAIVYGLRLCTGFWLVLHGSPKLHRALHRYRATVCDLGNGVDMGVISKISRLPANLLILLFGCLFFLLPGCGNDVVNKTDVGTLSINATGVGFGNVVLNTPKTQTVILSSTGIESITVSSAAVTGVGFSLAGSTIPITLAPGETATLFVQFDPTEVGAATGQLAIASNSSSNATVAIPLTGTGISASYAVELSWDAPSSSKDPIAGYNIYRSTGNTLAYQLLNSQVNTQTGYVDSAVENGQSYNYTVTSVDASGVESVPTSPVAVVIP